MTAHDVFLEARKRGLQIEAAGDKLAVIPKGACPPDFAAVLREHKAELLDWLNRAPCPGWGVVPPADLPLDPVQPKPSQAAARSLMSYLVRQIGGEAGPLCEWCLQRETTYRDTCHWPDEVCAYAAARDAACWQLRRGEVEVWKLLAGIEEAAGD